MRYRIARVGAGQCAGPWADSVRPTFANSRLLLSLVGRRIDSETNAEVPLATSSPPAYPAMLMESRRSSPAVRTEAKGCTSWPVQGRLLARSDPGAPRYSRRSPCRLLNRLNTSTFIHGTGSVRNQRNVEVRRRVEQRITWKLLRAAFSGKHILRVWSPDSLPPPAVQPALRSSADCWRAG